MNHAIEPVPPPPAGARRPIPPSPVHPLAALTTIVLDNVFGWVELLPGAVLGTSFLVGGLNFLATLFVQRFLAKDGWGESLAKGLVMGIIAGVPFQVTGTAVGAILLGWAGASQWIRLPARKPSDGFPAEGQEIVDVQAKDNPDSPD